MSDFQVKVREFALQKKRHLKLTSPLHMLKYTCTCTQAHTQPYTDTNTHTYRNNFIKGSCFTVSITICYTRMQVCVMFEVQFLVAVAHVPG